MVFSTVNTAHYGRDMACDCALTSNSWMNSCTGLKHHLLSAVLKVPPTKQLSSIWTCSDVNLAGSVWKQEGTDGGHRGMLEGSVYEGLWKSLRKPHPLLLTEFGETGTRAHAVIVAQEKTENKNNSNTFCYMKNKSSQTRYCVTNTDSSFTS